MNVMLSLFIFLVLWLVFSLIGKLIMFLIRGDKDE